MDADPKASIFEKKYTVILLFIRSIIIYNTPCKLLVQSSIHSLEFRCQSRLMRLGIHLRFFLPDGTTVMTFLLDDNSVSTLMCNSINLLSGNPECDTG